jgi:opacity protein-like surface antigen
MIRKFVTALAFALLLPGVAVAQGQANSVYLELKAGAAYLTDSELEADLTADVDVTYDIGWLVDGAVGYAHESGLRGELALGYRSNELDEFEFSGMSVEGDGRLAAFTAMANGYYDFYLDRYGTQGPAANLTPFIGGGVGVAILDVDDDDDNVSSESDTVFAYQAIAGLSYAFTRNIAGSLSYAYFATTDAKFGEAELDYNSHNVMLGIRYSF